MTFLVVAFLLSLLALVIVIAPMMMRRWNDRGANRRALNVALYHDRMNELQGDLQTGRINQHQFDELQSELARSLLSDVDDSPQTLVLQGNKHWLTTTLLAIVLLLGGFGLYHRWGYSEHVAAWAFVSSQAPGVVADGQTARNIAAGLQSALARNPEDVNTWFLLAQVHMGAEQYRDAVAAYRKLHAITGDEPAVLAQYAQAQFLYVGGKLDTVGSGLVDKLLAVSPAHPEALNLRAVDAYKKGDYATALQSWHKVLGQTPQGTADYDTVVGWVTVAYEKWLSADPDAAKKWVAAAQSSQEAATAPAAPKVEVTVRLATDIANKWAAETVVFIYARAPEGPPMPLAVEKHTVGELPLDVVLDDGDAMVSGRGLSSVSRVLVGARVSLSGDPMPREGDWQAEPKIVDLSASSQGRIELEINQAVSAP